MPFNFQITFNDGPTSAGDSPQLSGRISGMVITNNSGESISYSSDSGSSFATLTAGSSVTLGAGDPTSFRFRRVNSGSYPLAVDAVVTMSVPMSEGYFDTNPVYGLVVNDATLATATANTAAINTALLTGARFGAKVTINNPGAIWINGSIVQQNRTTLHISAGTKLIRYAGSDVPVIKTKSDSYTMEAVKFSRSGSSIVTVVDKNHTLSVGDSVSVRNLPTSAYNGIWTVASVTSAGWTYDCGASATDTAGATDYYGWIVPINRTISASNVSTTQVSSTVTITIASPGVITWTAHGLQDNQPIKLATTGALPTGLVAGTTYYVVPYTNDANTFQLSATKNGAAIVTTGSQSGVHTASYSYATVSDPAIDMRVGMRCFVTPYNTADGAYGGTVQVAKVWSSTNNEVIDRWIYYTPGAAVSSAPTGTLGLTYAYDVTIEGGGQIDGNRSGVVTTTPRSNITSWSMVNNLVIKNLIITGTNNRGVNCFNAYGVHLEDICFDNVASAITFEGGSADTAVYHCYASDANYTTGVQQTDDFLAYLGEKMLNTGTIIDVTPSAFGITDHENAVIEGNSCINSLNGMKFIGDATQTFRNFKIKNFSGIIRDPTPSSNGQTAVYMSDDGTGALSGCRYESFEFDGISWKSDSKLAALNGILLGQQAAHGKIVVKNFAQDPSQLNALYLALGSAGSIRQLEFLDCDWYGMVKFQRRPIYIYSGTIATLKLSGTFKLTGNANNAVVYVEGSNPSPLVQNLVISDSRYEGSAANTGYLVAVNGAVNNITYQNVKPLKPTGNGCNALTMFFPNSFGQAVASAINVFYVGSHIRGNNGFSDGGNALGGVAVNIYAAATTWDNTGGGNFVDLGGASATPCAIYAGTDCKISSNALTTSAAALYSLFAPTLKAAVNAGTAGTTIARTAGATFFNTAAAGTLVANNVVMCDATAAANSWKQLTALGNTY